MDATESRPGGPAQEAGVTGVLCQRRQRGGGCATLHLRLHSPDGQNRLARATVLALRRALREGAADPSTALVLVEADGQAFCAGGDQQEQAAMDGPAFRAFLAEIAGLYRDMLACQAPVLACVQGHAVGGGAAIALSCDMVVAAAEAKFAFPEARLGLAGPGFLLHRAGAFQRFAALCFGGRAQTAQELLGMGLVNAVAAPGNFVAERDDFVQAILRQTPAGLRATKASLAAAATPMLDALERHVEIQAQAFERQLAENDA